MNSISLFVGSGCSFPSGQKILSDITEACVNYYLFLTEVISNPIFEINRDSMTVISNEYILIITGSTNVKN